MSTNFYWNPELIMEIFGVDNVDTNDPKVHIGKRMNAGNYCWECGITQSGHTCNIHTGPHRDKTDQVLADIMYIKSDACPNCGKPWTNVTSFTFTMMGHLKTIGNFYNLDTFGLQQQGKAYSTKHIIMDEMGMLYTSISFMDDVIRKCPITFQDYGRWS